MNLKNWKRAFIFIIIGSVQYVVLTFIAMLSYAGGSYINHNAPGYSFWSNYFSGLGQ
jgi:hypothetical protein